MISCISDDDISNDSGLLIEISNGYNIIGNDIEFYDSSTCILFLKEKINFQYRSSEPVNYHFEDFSVYVDDNFIYKGTFFPSDVSGLSPTPNYIACTHMDSINSNILQLKFINYPENSVDNRNNSRLIDFYERNKLLRKGIKFSIHKVEVSPANDSILIVNYSIKNNDEISYLIPDPNKMNKWQISRLRARGNAIRNLDTNELIFEKHDIYSTDDFILTINNLSVIEKLEEIEFSMELPLQFPLIKGTYSNNFMFQNDMNEFYKDLDQNQVNGRIWIGECRFKFDFYIN
jgi:hypothetical protein